MTESRDTSRCKRSSRKEGLALEGGAGPLLGHRASPGSTVGLSWPQSQACRAAGRPSTVQAASVPVGLPEAPRLLDALQLHDLLLEGLQRRDVGLLQDLLHRRVLGAVWGGGEEGKRSTWSTRWGRGQRGCSCSSRERTAAVPPPWLPALTCPLLGDDAVLPLLDGLGDDPASAEGNTHPLPLLRVAPLDLSGLPKEGTQHRQSEPRQPVPPHPVQPLCSIKSASQTVCGPVQYKRLRRSARALLGPLWVAVGVPHTAPSGSASSPPFCPLHLSVGSTSATWRSSRGASLAT